MQFMKLKNQQIILDNAATTVRVLVFSILLIGLYGCKAMPSGDEKPLMTPCGDPRPEACTMEYRPVCGELTDGKTKTYGNACSACGDPLVSGFRAGECDGNG